LWSTDDATRSDAPVVTFTHWIRLPLRRFRFNKCHDDNDDNDDDNNDNDDDNDDNDNENDNNKVDDNDDDDDDDSKDLLPDCK
jgi:hypothetical protein